MSDSNWLSSVTLFIFFVSLDNIFSLKSHDDGVLLSGGCLRLCRAFISLCVSEWWQASGVIAVYCDNVYICHCGLRCFIKLTAWCATASLSWCYGCCEQTAKWFRAAGLLCSWSATFVVLIFCLMIAVTCTWGIHQHSGVRKVSYSLLLTVNNELMCKADFCGCVVPHPDCCLLYCG